MDGSIPKYLELTRLKLFHAMNLDTPTPLDVRLQLSRMLRSKTFANSPQVSKLLKALVEAAIREMTLTDYELGIKLGKPKEWVPDHFVRQTKINLRERIEAYRELSANHDPIIIEVPDGAPHRAIYYYNPDLPTAAASPLTPFGVTLFSSLEEFFDGTATGNLRCVVTGEPGASWYQLDGRPLHFEPGNLIPLCDEFRVYLNALRDGGKRSELPDLNPKRLAERTAPQCFANRDSTRAYGCAALAFHMGEPPFGSEPPETRILRLRDMLYYARHCFDGEVIGYILRNSLFPLLGSMDSLDPAPAYRLALELAALANESRFIDEADQCVALRQQMEKRFSNYLKDMGCLYPFATLRRKAHLAATRNPGGRESANALSEAREYADLSLDTSLMLTMVTATENLRIEPPEKNQSAYDTLLPTVIEYKPMVLSYESRFNSVAFAAANLSEAFLCAAIAACRFEPNGWEDFAREAFTAAYKLLRQAGHRLPREWWDIAAKEGKNRNLDIRAAIGISENDVRPPVRNDLRRDLNSILKRLSQPRFIARAKRHKGV